MQHSAEALRPDAAAAEEEQSHGNEETGRDGSKNSQGEARFFIETPQRG